MTTFDPSQVTLAAEAFRDTPSEREVAITLGVSTYVARRLLRQASQLGLVDTTQTIPLPGFVITDVSQHLDDTGAVLGQNIRQTVEADEDWAPVPGMFIKGVSSYVKGGKIVAEWKMQRKDDAAAHAELVEYLKSTFDGLTSPHVPVILPPRVVEDQVNLFPCNDWHINMLAWERETPENWDIKIAEQRIGDAMCKVIVRAGFAGLGIVLGGGDLMHNDNNNNRTEKSGHSLDCDTRHAKGREAAIRMMIRVIDTALLYNSKVLVRFLKGNHDEYTTGTIMYYLSAFYRNEPRVEVDLDENLFWCYQHGASMLVATHGHTLKMADMPQVMAGYWPKVWGETDFHFGHFFHVHHRDKIMSEHGHCIVESHRAPIPKDGWHYGAGYLSGRDVQAISYDSQDGETGRVFEVIRPG